MSLSQLWLFAPLLAALVVLPGLGVSLALLKDRDAGLAEALSLAAAVTVAWVSALAIVAHGLRLPLGVVLAGYLLAWPVSFAMSLYLWRRGSRLRAEWLGPAVGVGAAWLAVWEQPWFRGGADTFYHLAATRSLLVNGRPLVTDPFLGTDPGVLDPTSGAWHTMQALLSLVTRTDVADLYLGITGLGAGLLALAFWALSARVSGSAWAATLVTVGVVVFVFHGDLRALAYPKHLSLAFAFTGIAAFARLLDKPDKRALAAAVVAGFAAATTHLGAGQLWLTAGGVVVVVVSLAWIAAPRGEGLEWASPRLVSLLGALGLVVVASLPVLLMRVSALEGSPALGEGSWDAIARETLRLGPFRIVRPGGLYLGEWPWLLSLALAVLAGRVALREREAGALIAFALLILGPVLLNDPLVTTPLLHYSSYIVARIGLLARFAPLVGIAWGLGVLGPMLRGSSTRRLAMLAVPAVAALALAAMVVQSRPALATTFLGEETGRIDRKTDTYSIFRTREFDIRRSWGERTLEQVCAEVGDRYPVVAAEDLTAFYLAGLAPVAIVQPPWTHSPAYLETRLGPERRKAMEHFFGPRTSRAQRHALAEKYRVEYVAVWPERTWTRVRRDLGRDPYFRRVVSSYQFELYKVTGEAGSRPGR